MDSLKNEKMESKSQCEIQHPTPPIPHYALSEGVLRLESSSTQDPASHHYGGSGSGTGGIGNCSGGGGAGIVSKSDGELGSNFSGSGIVSSIGTQSGSGISTTTIKASSAGYATLDADDEIEDEDDCEHELTSTERVDRQFHDEDDVKDPNGVHFQMLSRAFTPDDDIFVIYELGDDVIPSASDWVALVPAPSTSVSTTSTSVELWTPEMAETAVWRETAPQASTNRDFPYLRSIFVNLSSRSIPPSDSILYRFLFVSAMTKKILGRSSTFNITDKPFVDTEVKDITSILEVLVDVGDIPGLDPGSLKRLKSFMEPVEHRSEPDCIVNFKRHSQTASSSTLTDQDAQQLQPRLLRPDDRAPATEEHHDDEEEGACPWDRDGSIEDLLSKSLKMLESVSTVDSFMTVPSEKSSFVSVDGEVTTVGGEVAGGGGECRTCSGYKEKLEEMRKLQEESQKTIAEIQQKLKEGKEQLAAHSSKENTSSRTKKLEEKLRNIRLSKRRLEDELVEAIGRAARSKEEVMEIRQTMHENSSKVERNVAEMTELKSSLTAKEKELKDLHEYVENIHYTLSTKGVLEPKKENGDGTSTEIPDNGKLVDLESQTWSVSESRKKGALRAKLTNQSGVIDHLHHTLGRLDKERADALRRAERAEKTIDVQGVEISKLKEAVAKMKQEASRAANRVESLSKIIVQERQMLQARMEKVREALMNVESARKLKLANNERGSGSSSLVGGGGGGGGWASGSDRAAAVAQRKNVGQEPQTAPEAVRANSASGVGGVSGGGGAGGKSRFVSPGATPTPSPKKLPTSPPTSGAFFFGAPTSSSNKSGGGKSKAALNAADGKASRWPSLIYSAGGGGGGASGGKKGGAGKAIAVAKELFRK